MKNSLSKPNTIYIPNEIKVREFDGKLLLSYFLTLSGYSVKIGSRSGIKREILSDNNGIYMPKSLTIAQLDFYKELKKRNHKLIVMHSEGSVLLKDIKQELISMYPKKCSEYIDHFLVSGLEIKKMMLKHTPYIEKDRIHVVGDPRFDLIKLKFKSYWLEGIEKLEKKYGQFILINTNFATGNSKIGNENLLKYILNNPDYSDDFKNVRIHKQTFIHNILKYFLDLIDDLSVNFPNYNFIIRPHPSENDAPYINAFKLKKNVRVIHSGNVIKWIHASKAVIHYDCTTGIESLIAEKLAISYTPKVDKNILAWLPVLASKNVKLKSEVNKIIENLASEEKIILNDSKTEILNKFIFNLKNESSEIIASLFNKIKLDKPQYNYSLRDFLNNYFIRIKSKIIVKLFDNGLLKQQNSYSLGKFSSIRKKEIFTAYSKFSNIYNLENKISVKIYGGNVAHIKNKKINKI